MQSYGSHTCQLVRQWVDTDMRSHRRTGPSRSMISMPSARRMAWIREFNARSL